MRLFRALMQRADHGLHRLVETENQRLRFAVYVGCALCVVGLVLSALPELQLALKYWQVTLCIAGVLFYKVYSVYRRVKNEQQTHQLIALGLLGEHHGRWSRLALIGAMTEKVGAVAATRCVEDLLRAGLIELDEHQACVLVR